MKKKIIVMSVENMEVLHCNINVTLNHKISVVLYNLKSYDSRLILQELGKFNLKINVIPN